ncbi:hypothetical protein [Paenibacillus eucommiae]|uniref:Uncharacterized protein n=1 Tax=Paenibacillus eucommiae TaxID=1355755 RepID=A0ABS4J3S8_9BACL|nr:hypothetical protein [Paenibacillus eucommiae]MBP1994473.1 hypothetical protein [Paenibacillus eucommiae]
MIKTKFTKSAMENEEGMNHLWIQIAPIGQADQVHVQIVLPAGVHRLHNLSGFPETAAKEIQLPNPLAAADLVIELFTRDPVMPGEKTVIVALTYKDSEGKHSRLEHYVPLSILAEEESDSLLVDEEAVAYIKELLLHRGLEHKTFIDYSKTPVIRIDPNKYSDLEKKYRIEGELYE